MVLTIALDKVLSFSELHLPDLNNADCNLCLSQRLVVRIRCMNSTLLQTRRVITIIQYLSVQQNFTEHCPRCNPQPKILIKTERLLSKSLYFSWGEKHTIGTMSPQFDGGSTEETHISILGLREGLLEEVGPQRSLQRPGGWETSSFRMRR